MHILVPAVMALGMIVSAIIYRYRETPWAIASFLLFAYALVVTLILWAVR